MSRKRKRTFLLLKVTSTEEYIIDMDCTDGRTQEQVIQEWFTDFPLHNPHAARDHGRVGYSKKLVSVENQGLLEEDNSGLTEPLPDPSS